MFREMRRFKQQITTEECKKVLKEEKRAAFSVIGDEGYPYTIPINFYYDEAGNFLFERVNDMIIREVNENKKQFISLLLLADEQENMIDRYIEKGTMYVLEDDNVKAECVVTDEGNGILEIKNIAVDPENRGMGYGKTLIDFIASQYADEYSILQVGTGDSPLTIPFYEKCGFVRFHKIPNFFTDNYDHPIYEGGVQLIDMVYLQRHI